MDSLERILGKMEEFMVNAVDHRRSIETKIDGLTNVVNEIKKQVYLTNGRVTGHDDKIKHIVETADELQEAFKEHSERGIKTDSYLSLLWITIFMFAGGLVTFVLEMIFKK